MSNAIENSEFLVAASEISEEIINTQQYIVENLDNLNSKLERIDEVEENSKNASNINKGILNKSYGGTSNASGIAQDVEISEGVTAKSVGQLGDAVVKNAVDTNTLVNTGNYYCTNCTTALNYPLATNFFMQVMRNGSHLIQIKGVYLYYILFLNRK